MTNTYTDINIETLVLVAVWQETSVFQGCFKISDQHSTRKRYLFFRCESQVSSPLSLLQGIFSPYDYHWTSLFEETTQAHWDVQDETKEHAYYVLKYALYTTLCAMVNNRKYDLMSVDEVAMEAMLLQVKPMLQKSEASWSHSYPDLGFAVAMDFNPSESMSEEAAVILLAKRSVIH